VRVLLDESVPHDLVPLLVGHDVQTVQGRGWAGTKNGALLALAEPDFDVFLTADRNIPHQQNLAAFDAYADYARRGGPNLAGVRSAASGSSGV
jgi:hypothetical protein